MNGVHFCPCQTQLSTVPKLCAKRLVAISDLTYGPFWPLATLVQNYQAVVGQNLACTKRLYVKSPCQLSTCIPTSSAASRLVGKVLRLPP